MANNKFTPEQQEVISDRGNNLLISAAAGSGKTTVMIERIKELIVSEHVPIENFLVVTFTKASSIDMKARLISKLSSLQPTPFIIEQIDNINTADVSNLHSFCARLLKSYFYEAGLDPSFVVLSDEETQTLKEKALNILFDQKFEQADQDFFVLLDVLQKNRSDKELRTCILKLHEFFNVIFNHDQWFSSCINSLYNQDLNKNQACNIINGYVCGRIEKLQEEINDNILIYNKIGIKEFVEYLQTMQSSLMSIRKQNGFIKNAQNIFELDSFSTPPKVEEAFVERREDLDKFRKYINKEIKNFQLNFISNDISTLQSQLNQAQQLATTLYKSAKEFGGIYADLKKEKSGLDYNDLEQYTLKILENDQILGTLREKYKYVFVDEYQDINAVQEKIISLLSGTNNRFMVGDIKQSIYGFRLCDPDIFLQKYYSYKTDKNSKSIDLSKNFRSNAHILNFVNMIFNGRMTEDFGGIDYQNVAQLVAGASFSQEDPVNVKYINSNTLSSSENSQFEADKIYSVKNHSQGEELENLKSRAEASYIASEILDIVANKTIFDAKLNINRSIRFRDIAILIPARNEFLTLLLDEFAAAGIPASTDASQNVLNDRYVKCVYNFLKLIYNHKQDIELFSVLYSPLSDFTLNELANLRIYQKDCRFFHQCLDNCGKNCQIDAKLSKKVENFMKKLQKYRNLAGYKTVKEIANQVIADYDLQNIMLTEPDGSQRLNLLNKFVESLPLSSVFEYFSDDSQLAINAEKTADVNAVQIVTIHKSKGLEYPVVFVANINRQFNMQSLHGNMLISKEYGLAIDFFDQQERYKNVTVAKEAIKLAETRKTIEEQQRLLYVALTRAINKLYVVGCEDIDKLKQTFPERKSCFADWFDPFVYEYLQGKQFDNINFEILDASVLINSMPVQQFDHIGFGDSQPMLKNIITQSINFEYPYLSATQTPQKTSVTQIASGYHESEEISQSFQPADKSSIENGNAYHKLIQYINFDCNDYNKLQKEIQRLLKSGQILQSELELIDLDNILKLLNNPDFQQIVSSGYIMREREFFMNMHQDLQIVQGVVDLAVINNNQAIIADYKTGNFSSKQNLQKYAKQIDLYAQAIEKSFDCKVTKRAIIAVENGTVHFL